MESKTVTSVFLICSGLGNVQRGYESFTKECFEALQQETSLELFLFKGGGKSQPREFSLPNLPRASWLAEKLSKIFRKDTYFIEQFTFCLSLIPHIYQQRPDVIFFSDFNLGTILWHFRRATGLPYRLLFCNGAPNGPPFSRTDYVQHTTPTHYYIALEAGEPSNKHFLVPQGIKMNDQLKVLSQEERSSLCYALGLPRDRPILLSVAAINKNHKRMDYLIREVAQLPEPRPFLLLLGHQDNESVEIVDMGNELLGQENFQVKTVSLTEISKYYQVADLFVLASLGEGFGRVLVEAMSYGLPCLAHDYETTQFVLNGEGFLANLELSGSLANLMSQVLAQDNDDFKHRRHQSVYQRFSWDRLRYKYVKIIHCCVES
jgi:glycosyltransferase involved in cell wall biosynthesis